MVGKRMGEDGPERYVEVCSDTRAVRVVGRSR